MVIFEFQNQQYIALQNALQDVMGLSLESVLVDFIDRLCFYYQDTVIYNDDLAGFYGMVFPEKNLITSQQVDISLKYADLHKAQVTVLMFGHETGKLKKLSDANRHKYIGGYINSGRASSNNAVLLNQHLTQNDFFADRSKPSCVFHLRQHVLPYYLIPVDFLVSYIERKGIAADLAILKKAEIASASKLIAERGQIIPDIQPTLASDLEQSSQETYRQKITALNAQVEDLQAILQDNNAQLKAALATIERLELKSPPNDSPSSAALRAIGGLAISRCNINIHNEPFKGINNMGNQLARVGVAIDPTTLRKLLKSAANIIEPPKNHAAYQKT